MRVLNRFAVSAVVALGACAGKGGSGPVAPMVVDAERIIPSIEALDRVKAKCKLTIRNVRATPVTVTGFSYSFTAEDPMVESVSKKIEAKHVIEAGTTVSIELEEEMRLPIKSDGYLDLLAKRSVPVKLAGSVTFDDETSTDFVRAGSVAMPKLPKLVVFQTQAGRYEGEGVNVIFYLRLVNENPFGTVVETATYAIELEGKTVTDGTAGIGIRLVQGGAQEYEVNADIDESTFGSDYKKYLKASIIDYVVSGELTIEGITTPYSHGGTIEFD